MPASSIVVHKVRVHLSKYAITDPLFLLCVFQVPLPFLVHVWHVNQVLWCNVHAHTRTLTLTCSHTHWIQMRFRISIRLDFK